MKTQVNGIDVDYRDQDVGLPVLFIHAFPLNQTMWDEQVAALRTHSRAITLDLRGFGKTDAPPGSYTMDQMAADVRGLMTVLEIDRAVLVGLSMGGYVSLALYRNYPDVVGALVLADTRAGADTHAARERRLKSAEKAERDGARAIADDMIQLLVGRTTLERRPAVVERVRKMIEANSPKGIAGAQRGMAERRDSTYILAGIDFPTLIIVGDEDTLTPVAEAEGLRSGIRGARLEVIDGAGHLSNLERPDKFNSVLIDFVNSLKESW
ncbi:MAG TPA: alpha/beta fold hydrolase [Blastocatellia bacterium]|nr:alpha/beta fold hydrolase [Blastocatellia bacterium]